MNVKYYIADAWRVVLRLPHEENSLLELASASRCGDSPSGRTAHEHTLDARQRVRERTAAAERAVTCPVRPPRELMRCRTRCRTVLTNISSTWKN